MKTHKREKQKIWQCEKYVYLTATDKHLKIDCNVLRLLTCYKQRNKIKCRQPTLIRSHHLNKQRQHSVHHLKQNITENV